MPRDPKRRRSLPSAIERNLSLHELIGDDDKHRTRRAKTQQKEDAALQQLQAYFAMIDKTELKVEVPSVTSLPSEASDSGADVDALSDSELVRPTQSTKSRSKRTQRLENLKVKKTQRKQQVEKRVVARKKVTPLRQAVEPQDTIFVDTPIM